MRFEAVKVHPNMNRMEIITGMYPCLRFGLKFAAKVPVNVWPCSVGTHPILMIYIQNQSKLYLKFLHHFQSPKHSRVSKLKPPPQCMHAPLPHITTHAGTLLGSKSIRTIFTIEVIIQSSKASKFHEIPKTLGSGTPPFPPPYPKKSQPKGPSSAAAPGTAPLRSLPSTAASPARCARCARGRAKAAAAAAPTPRGGQFHRCRHRRSP